MSGLCVHLDCFGVSFGGVAVEMSALSRRERADTCFLLHSGTERKQFLHESAHDKAYGLSPVTGLRFLEKRHC